MFDYIINTNTILQNQLCTNTLHPKRGRTQAHDPPNEQACLRLCVCVKPRSSQRMAPETSQIPPANHVVSA